MTQEDPNVLTRVMLVEDQADFMYLMQRLLGREPDIEVVVQATNLAEARARIDGGGFDVAVLDLNLPDGNGADLIEDLRRSNGSVAVLILSADLDPDNLARAHRAGADEILDKLAPPEEVVGAIRRCGSGERSAPQA